ncbi:MAG: Dihydrodipicolinate reductase [Bacteroidota bacterium]
MGQLIEKIALGHGHQIHCIVNNSDQLKAALQSLKKADVAIDFSIPSAALHNMYCCLEAGVPMVCGTTGWHQEIEKVKEKVAACKGALIASTNFSIGVHLFWKLNNIAAHLFDKHASYQLKISEVHHIQKKDQPSGTAITLAEKIIANQSKYQNWQLVTNDQSSAANTINIFSQRIADVPGTHTTFWQSDEDEIVITHNAKNRNGFAKGALIAAQWIIGKEGFFTLDDLLEKSVNN